MLPGKLPLEMLGRLLGRIDITDPRVALGPMPGEDAALIDFGDRYLVAKTDPITFATDMIGQYMVAVNANDLAVMGATPKWLLATILLPIGTAEREVSAIFEQIRSACAESNISIVGGHTEIAHGIDHPIAVGAMLGEVAKDEAIFSSGVRPADALILSKGIAVEGTSILAAEFPERLAAAGVSEKEIASARGLLFSPSISVVPDARIARESGEIHAMHDPTEGGLSGGLYELASASDLGFDIDADAISVLPQTQTVCDALGLDPLGLIASGALLAATASDDARAVIDALESKGIAAAVIGHATDRHRRVRIVSEGRATDFPRFARDELARMFGRPSHSDNANSE